MKTDLRLSPNPIVRYLEKPGKEFRRNDIIRFVKENGIRMINFMYPADDGRLKTLNFVINSEEYLESILTYGERVDGSSLFPFIEASNSDLYVIPKYSTAFVDPFSEIPTLVMLAHFYNKEGLPLDSSPQYTLHKACEYFHDLTGMDFHAMGELEYYVIAQDQGMFEATDQKGYHESSPFAKFNEFRVECMDLIARAGGEIKYGHSEVGNFSFEGRIFEQNEIEFLPVYAEDAASHLMLAKWIIRTNAMRRGFDVTFAPKITAGKAGSGLHIHFKIVKDGRNMMIDNGLLSNIAKKAIVGILENAESITAMGNKVPTSYLRLVPHQEAPTSICWGDRNRSVLIRVPLGWTGEREMCSQTNPLETPITGETDQRQTVELRSADCSADIYQLLAAMIVAAAEGFKMTDSLKRADDLYVSVNIHSEENKKRLESLKGLPVSCESSAAALESNRELYEKNGVFNHDMINGIINNLRSFHDGSLREDLEGDRKGMLELVKKFWNC